MKGSAPAARRWSRHRRAEWRALQSEAQRAARVAQRLCDGLEGLVSDVPLDEVIGQVTSSAQAAVGAREFALLLRERDALVCHSSSGLPPRAIFALEAWLAACPRTLEQPLVLDVRDVPALSGLVEQALPLRALASAPLTFPGESFGVLIALGTRPFLPGDIEVLQAFAGQLSIALNTTRLHHLTTAQADVDGLTGLLNHRSFHEALDLRLAAQPAERRGCVALVDLDNFKAVNDEDGHSAGDRLLEAAARGLSAACRGEDLAFRVGGDEFALLLPGLEERAASDVLAHVCVAISALDARLGASAGVAMLSAVPGKDAALELAAARLHQVRRQKYARSPRSLTVHRAA